MKFLIFFIMGMAAVSCEEPQLIYSSRYANVYYQGRQDGSEIRRAELNLAEKKQVPESTTNGGAVPLASEIEDLTATEQTNTATEAASDAEPIAETSTEPESEQIQFAKPERLTDASELSNANAQGIYYIYHPNGLLQKVVYAAKDDQENMEYFAQLNYENVEPIREPIYTYDPSTFVFQRLQIEQ